MKRQIQKFYCLFVLVSLAAPISLLRAEVIEAQWQVHQVRFQYMGLSTMYTCDGIENSLLRLLKLIGARDDARVEAKCVNQLQARRFHRVLLAFAMPVPADKSDLSKEVFPAQYEEVRVVGSISRLLNGGDCELLEEFERKVMPQLKVSKLGRKIRCIPNRREFNSLRYRVSALKKVENEELEPGRK